MPSQLRIRPQDGVDCVVIGAGVVGLAVARALAMRGRSTLIIEANAKHGEETSSRNNEVIHAGFLYETGSLKERLCGSGRELLYRYCEGRGVGHARLGKLMPATTDAEVTQLERLKARADALAIPVDWLDAGEAQKLEPKLTCLAALHSPTSGIVDAHALMMSLLGDAQAHGATLAVSTRVDRIEATDGGGFVVEAQDCYGNRETLACEQVINAAALGAETLASRARGIAALPKIHFAKGTFCTYHAAAPFRHLIVPVGETLALGGAFTLDLAGRGRFGPDLEWVGLRDYRVATDVETGFAGAARRYWPGIDGTRLAGSYAGIRPRITGPGEAPGDWLILGPGQHGANGLVHLLGIDTPGLTACLSIAEHVIGLLNEECDTNNYPTCVDQLPKPAHAGHEHETV